MENNKRYLVGFLALIIGFFLWRYISNPLTVTVSGTGRVSVPASSASVVVTALETANTAELVESAIRAKVAALRLAMVTGGISESSLSQSQVQVTPLSAVVSGATGFSAQVSLSGKTNDVSNLSGLVVRLYGAGATVVSQPVVEVENQKDLENQALQMAITDAESNLKSLTKIKRKLFRKMMSVQQASSGNASTTTKVTDTNGTSGSSIEVVKAVSVVYWLW